MIKNYLIFYIWLDKYRGTDINHNQHEWYCQHWKTANPTGICPNPMFVIRELWDAISCPIIAISVYQLNIAHDYIDIIFLHM